MSMHFEPVKMNRVDYIDGKYALLYPILNKYWDKLLAELPEVLKLRTINAVPLWDEIAGLDRAGRKSEQITRRQSEIKKYDMQRDPTQERETSYALVGYLRGGKSMDEFIEGQLQEQINKARSNGNDDVVTVLISKVLQPLEQICNEFGDHWPKKEILLWKAICEFKWTALYVLLANAEREKNDDLAKELKAVNTYLYRILNLDRVRVKNAIGDYEKKWETLVSDEDAAGNIPSASFVDGKNISKGFGLIDEIQFGNTCAATANQVEHVTSFEWGKKYGIPLGVSERTVKITKIAIKAAWQIECETGRKAFAKEVVKLLKLWVKSKQEADLIDVISNGVTWITSKTDLKAYDIDACRGTLKNWHKRREKIRI